MLFFDRRNLLFAIFVFLAFLASLLCFYTEEKKTSIRVALVERQVALLNQLLKSSNTVSEENKQKLQEIANRTSVISRSQDDLLTTTVAKATPAVVSIVISQDVPKLEVQYVNPFGDDPFFNNIGYQVPVFKQVGTERKQVGAGTGFIIRPDGYIVTNRHVVSDTSAEYTVLLSSGQKKTAQVVYRDPTNDVAVLKIDGSGYKSISFGSSESLQLGQTVVAIGNALGQYNNSVSVGIVSGLDRTIEAQDATGQTEKLAGVIQTDAAINPGNSGGPLLNLQGEVVGVNVAVSTGANSISFAVPTKDVKSVLRHVLP